MGNGFIARSLASVADRHPDTVAFAVGVSSAGASSVGGFAREAALLAASAENCRAEGRRLLFFSTCSAGMYDRAQGPGREDQPTVPANPYGAHKLALENLLRDSGSDYLVLRLGHLVGPGQPAHQLLPTLTRMVRSGLISVHRGADRDLIDVADVVRIIDLLLARDVRGETVNVASGTSVPVEAIVDQVERRLGVTAERVYLDGGSRHLVSTDKLKVLAPETAAFGFGPDYYRTVVDAFVSGELTHA
jgi:NDP-hexose 4-ketoreductase